MTNPSTPEQHALLQSQQAKKAKEDSPGGISLGPDPTPAPAGDKPAGGEPDLGATVKELQGKLSELGEANKRIEQQLMNQRKLENRRDGELHRLRTFERDVREQAAGGYIDPAQFTGTPSDTTSPGVTEPPQTQAATGQDANYEMMRWKVDNPGWEKKWDRVERILFHPDEELTRMKLMAPKGPDGNPNVYGTFDNIRNHLERADEQAELAELREKVAKAEEKKKELEAQRTGLNRMAYISGTPAAGSDSGAPDYEAMLKDPKVSSDDMVREAARRGHLEINPDDPPKALRGKKG